MSGNTVRKIVSISIVGAVVTAAAAGFHYHMVRVRAARLDHVVAPLPYFPAGSIWTTDISKAAADPHSEEMINTLSDAGGWGTGQMHVDFSIRVMQATPSTPMARFSKGPGWMGAGSDSVASIPLPPDGGVERQSGYNCAVDKEDCHLLVADHSRGKLYEAYQANGSAKAISANYMAVWDLNRVYPPSGRGEQCTSADAAGFPIAPLLFSADELAMGKINHAIRFIIPNTRIRANVFVPPATHAGGPRGPDSAIPYGARLRLKASYDVSHLKPAAQVVARAMQKYGMFLSDSGNMALTAQNDTDTTAKYADVGFGPLDLKELKVTDFEVMKIGTPIPLTYDCVRNP
jgi:hypothetical protein